jgi:hypothetical protein
MQEQYFRLFKYEMKFRTPTFILVKRLTQVSEWLEKVTRSKLSVNTVVTSFKEGVSPPFENAIANSAVNSLPITE